MTALKTGGRKPPTFLSRDGDTVRVRLERTGSGVLVHLETPDFACHVPATAFILERVARKLKGKVSA